MALLLPSTATRAQSTLQVLVCNSDETSSIRILEPLSDSLGNKPTIEITGEVFRANQIEVYVNDTYSGVVPLSYGATDFRTSVNVNPGTQTIQLVAVDICQVGNSAASVVLTYQPDVAPSTGSSTETNVDGVINNSAQGPRPQQQSFLEQYVLPPLVNIAGGLDLTEINNTADRSEHTPDVIRLALLLTGIGFIAGAYNIGLTGAVFRPRFNIRTKLSSRAVASVRIGVAGLGIIAIIIMFTL